MPTNTAAWLRKKYGPLEVGSAPYTHPREDEIVVRVRAVAINPLDWMVGVVGGLILPWLRYPAVLGSDVAGEVVEIGAAVTRFAVGDRVLGHAVGVEKSRNSAAEGAFQTYCVLLEHMAAPIPEEISYERAAVLPLGLSTAACGLFQEEFLALRLPSPSPSPTAASNGETVLVWGGSTSVGSNAIQLAVAAGYEVITTASPHNFGYVKNLGATAAFDYRSTSVIPDVVAALRSRSLTGTIAIGAGSAEACLDIVHATEGRKVIANASSAVSFESLVGKPGRLLRLVPLVARLLQAQTTLRLTAHRRGIRTNFIWGSALKDNEVGPAIYADFLPRALAEGSYLPAPEPLIVGVGLKHVQTGFATQIGGVSARKIVVSI